MRFRQVDIARRISIVLIFVRQHINNNVKLIVSSTSPLLDTHLKTKRPHSLLVIVSSLAGRRASRIAMTFLNVHLETFHLAIWVYSLRRCHFRSKYNLAIPFGSGS